MTKKFYKNKTLFTVGFTAITSIMFFGSLSPVMGSPRTQAQVRCIEPIGRVISTGDRYMRSGSLLCPTDQISPKQGEEVKVLCYSSREHLLVEAGSNFPVREICKPPAFSSVRKCTLLSPQDCPNRKGPNRRENAPNIIQPYGKVIINRRPLISWTAVPGATSYTVQLSGGEVKWEKEVVGTTLSYPQDQQELSYGSANKIIVIANKGNDPIIDDTLVVHVLPEGWVRQINQAIEQVKSLGLSADETAYIDLDAIYMSERLLNDTIENLQARVAAGSFNPTLYRILGDRYVEVWMPQLAKTAYIKALQLARFQKNSGEVELVQERLSALSQSQLPTRTNPAQ
ncbi:hypothetical protein H6G49_29075 [Nostoc sp. PCC 7120 = FACHB-418]|uniref:Uncharacterized protein n=2 Tax=Nostocales TaxID=1161 RepID=A0ABR7ZNL4_ANACY|nr:hypothetical protein [Anabaena cylindrica FACHB-318]MBD2267035.1 hypothetical protein [Anabaena sp. FACHB-709]MBD2276585.1 hypothetical protein [Nostoc sp. PCC 7120 = FACHB-418]MBD2286324.1 hypothetical protein [Anabaena cylindrica FACHB-170]BAB78317.1 alr7233 [Nostoc sp. PCC 7120 = FACHB-418]